ncbi:unnamed protein product [Mytilus edulis]|uniref:DZIP3-like HEPN domain-containing protein n=1 Tax=Mytilus edulis TaxID=6550 RepID=A0A8S3RBT6_MYTED|nr:unnamed protein product [Mytilus edulis]
MICLIRNLTSISPPINGFDKLPLPNETTPGADLARIKWYRNKLAHHDSNTFKTADFNAAWINLTDAVGRLGGLQMNHECQELKVKILDQSNQEVMLEIKQSQEEMKELKQTMDTQNLKVRKSLEKLKDSVSCLQAEQSNLTDISKETIPWNIRGILYLIL